MINQNFDILAACLALVGNASYAWYTFERKILPNRVSWVLWAAAPSISLAAELAQHVHIEVALLTFSEAVGALLVVTATFIDPKVFWKISRFDLACGAAACLSLSLWLITGQGDVALIFSLIASLLAGLPTIVKSYAHPASENVWAYLASLSAGLITLLTIQHWTLANYGFPLYITLESALISFLVLTPQRLRKTLGSARVETAQQAGTSAPPVPSATSTPRPAPSVAAPAPAAPTGLTAASPTQVPTISWAAVPEASSYNVYRDGIRVGSSTTSTFTDASATNNTHTYYVTAINQGGESGPSNSVSVLVDQTPPTITYSLSQQPNEHGWHNKPVTITFTAEDPKVGISACSPPVTLSSDGINQRVVGSAMNYAGDSSSITVVVSIDQTPPTLGQAAWSVNPVRASAITTLSVPVVDHASGVVRGEYIGSIEPGHGNGIPMTVSNGNLSVTLNTTVPPGSYLINIRAEDAAGNWSELLPTVLTVT